MSLHDLWGGKRTGPGKRWQVRYREAGRQHKRNFDTKEAALTFEARRRLEPEQRLAREGRALTVCQMMETWLATKTDKARKTQEAYAYDARQVTAEFGDRLATSVRPSEIRVWVARPAGVSSSPTLAHRATSGLRIGCRGRTVERRSDCEDQTAQSATSRASLPVLV